MRAYDSHMTTHAFRAAALLGFALCTACGAAQRPSTVAAVTAPAAAPSTEALFDRPAEPRSEAELRRIALYFRGLERDPSSLLAEGAEANRERTTPLMRWLIETSDVRLQVHPWTQAISGGYPVLLLASLTGMAAHAIEQRAAAPDPGSEEMQLAGLESVLRWYEALLARGVERSEVLDMLLQAGEEGRLRIVFRTRLVPAARAAIAGRPASVRSASTMPVDGDVLANTLAEIAAARAWRDRVSSDKPEFLADVEPRFGRWREVMGALTRDGRHDDADRVAAAVVALRNHWGAARWPIERYAAFGRDEFFVGELRVLVGQYFEPVDYYEGDPQIKKLYFFTVYEGDRVLLRYHLEYSNIMGPYYVLGSMDRTSHRQLRPYGSRQPPYRALREVVIADLQAMLTRAAEPAAP
jgi:hypothetical protein